MLKNKILGLVTQIHEFKGRQELYLKHRFFYLFWSRSILSTFFSHDSKFLRKLALTSLQC